MHVPIIPKGLSRILSWRHATDLSSSLNKHASEPPLREELYNIDQLERHAKGIAKSHQLTADRTRDKLLPRLDENQRVLIETYDLVSASADQNRRIEPAAEWLLDNFYLVEEQIRAIRCLATPLL